MPEYKYKKLYQEKSPQEQSLTDCLIKLCNSMDVNKDPYFFGRAVGNAIEDSINTIVKGMEKSKVVAEDKESFVNNFVDMLIKTIKSTKDLHKNRNAAAND